jgi:hypothetical protein
MAQRCCCALIIKTSNRDKISAEILEARPCFIKKQPALHPHPELEQQSGIFITQLIETAALTLPLIL